MVPRDTSYFNFCIFLIEGKTNERSDEYRCSKPTSFWLSRCRRGGYRVRWPRGSATERPRNTFGSGVLRATACSGHAGIRRTARVRSSRCCTEGTALQNESGSAAAEQCLLRLSRVEPGLHGPTAGGPAPVYVPRQCRTVGGIDETTRRLGAAGEWSALERTARTFWRPLPFRQRATRGDGGSGGQSQGRLHGR
jgi:hypothetical protein